VLDNFLDQVAASASEANGRRKDYPLLKLGSNPCRKSALIPSHSDQGFVVVLNIESLSSNSLKIPFNILLFE
jgi:hypothetical protein